MKKRISQNNTVFETVLFPNGTFSKSIVLIIALLISIDTWSQISRTTMMSNATPYSTFTWTAYSNNITSYWNGDLCPSPSYAVYAAPWVNTTGTKTAMPYSFGGWSTQSQHTTAMSAGKSAGNVCTAAGGGCVGGGDPLNSCASGQDCSGFISRSWALGTKQNTAGLASTTYSKSYSFAYQTIKGDIFTHTASPTHCILVSTYSAAAGGTWVVYEAVGYYWKVRQSTYYWDDLTGFYAKYNKNVCATVTPTGLTNYAPTTSTIAYLIWSNESKTYNYRYKLTTAATWTTVTGYSSPTLTLSGLTPNKGYNFQVQSVCGVSSGSWTSSFTFYTLPLRESETTTYSNDIVIFPNPASEGQTISVEGINGANRAEIFSLDGKFVSSVTIHQDSHTFILPANLFRGIYLIQFTTAEGQNISEKIIVQ